MRQSFFSFLFYSLYFIIYGGIHAYVYFKLRSALGAGWKWTGFYALFALIMIAGARTLWAVDLSGFPVIKQIFSYSVYSWMAFIFMTFNVFIMLDLIRIFLWAIDGALSSRFGELMPSPRVRVAAALIIAAGLCIYGWFEALDIRPVYITIMSGKLPPGVDRVRVAQISDVHLGWIIREERLASMLEVVRGASPDMLVITGDLVDGDMQEREEEVALFRDLNLPEGVFAVTGNHEYHAGIDQALAFMEHSGIRVLRNEAVRAGGIVLAGVDDRAGRFYGHGEIPPDASVLAGAEQDSFVLFLKHQPIIEPEAVGLFDLQLSGHTHGGQIWPFSVITARFNKTKQGLWAIVPHGGAGQAHAESAEKRSMIYISNGTGTWGPPIRFLAPSEITVFDIVKERAPQE